MNILIVGGGAIGTTYGAYLSKAAQAVTLLVRRAEHAQDINTKPVTIHYPDKTESYHLKAITDPSAAKDIDLAIFSTKVYDLEKAFETARPALSPDTIVMSIQNGIQHYDLLRAAFPDHIAVGAISYSGLNKSSDTDVKSAGTFRTVIGDNDGTIQPTLDRIQGLFQSADMTCEIEIPVKNALWQKQMLTSMQQALGALTGNTFERLLKSNHCQTIARLLFDETQKVAASQGVHFDSTMCDKVIANWARIPTHSPSMVKDFQNGRKTEIHMANGYIAELAEQSGLDAPLNKAFYHLVKAIEENHQVDKK